MSNDILFVDDRVDRKFSDWFEAKFTLEERMTNPGLKADMKLAWDAGFDCGETVGFERGKDYEQNGGAY